MIQKVIASKLEVSVVTAKDNLTRLVEEINSAAWDDANEMSSYDTASLLAYLERQDTLFVACYVKENSSRTLLGFASSRFELKPYGGEKWLYVDEVDVCSDQRQKGAGTAIMRKLFDLASNAGCAEVWLGTEVENVAANALYNSLEPDDVAQVIGYTYELDE